MSSNSLIRILACWLLFCLPVSAQVPMTGAGVGAPSGGGGSPLTFTWTGSGAANTAPAPPQPFASIPIGTASSDRIIVITIAARGAALNAGAVITSVTVAPGGVSPVSLAQAVIAGGGLVTAQSQQVFWGVVSGAGTTATITISGYTNGFITSFAFNVGVMKGSATASVASVINTIPPAYNMGGTATAITVPTNGMTVISTYSDNNAPTTGVTTTYNTVAADKDQSSGATFDLTGSMFHLNTSTAAMNVTSTTSSAFGWVAANFQP